MTQRINPLAEIFGEPIHIYSRAQALADGVLLDVTAMAREAGFLVPVAMTAGAWADCVFWPKANNQRQTTQDESGRLWDVLSIAVLAAKRARDERRIAFNLYRVPGGGRVAKASLTTLHLVIGPDDNGEPVITILLPNED